MSKIFLLLFLILSCKVLFAQEIKLGQIRNSELLESTCPIDSDAEAQVLYRSTKITFEINDRQRWELKTKVVERIKIYNPDGYEWATKKIRLYKNGGERERLTLKGFVHYLDNEMPRKRKLKASEIDDEDIGDYWSQKSFSFPEVRDGCIVEWSYTITSPFLQYLRDLEFQYEIPVKIVEGEILIPQRFGFRKTTSGFCDIEYSESEKNRVLTYTQDKSRIDLTRPNAKGQEVSRSDNVNVLETVLKAKLENVPALKWEPHIYHVDNYRCRTTFELVSYQPDGGMPSSISENWDVVVSRYLSGQFGLQYDKTGYFWRRNCYFE